VGGVGAFIHSPSVKKHSNPRHNTIIVDGKALDVQ